MATHSNILAWRIPRSVGYSLWGHKELDMAISIYLLPIGLSSVYCDHMTF